MIISWRLELMYKMMMTLKQCNLYVIDFTIPKMLMVRDTCNLDTILSAINQ